MPQIDINGASLYYEEKGEGFPVVFTHGLGSDSTMWAFQVPVFSEQYRVIAWDVRGHGKSEVTDEGYSIDQFVSDLDTLLVKLGVERAHMIGLSMGGWISWKFAADHPEKTERLVLSDSAGLTPKDTPEEMKKKRDMFALSAQIAEEKGREPLVQTTLELMFSKDFIENSPEVVDMVRKRIVADRGIGYARTISRMFLPYWDAYDEEAAKKELAKIKAPTLVIAGELDVLTPLPTQEALAEYITGAELKKIPGSGHVPPVEKKDEWNDAVLDFLSS